MSRIRKVIKNIVDTTKIYKQAKVNGWKYEQLLNVLHNELSFCEEIDSMEETMLNNPDDGNWEGR